MMDAIRTLQASLDAPQGQRGSQGPQQSIPCHGVKITDPGSWSRGTLPVKCIAGDLVGTLGEIHRNDLCTVVVNGYAQETFDSPFSLKKVWEPVDTGNV